MKGYTASAPYSLASRGRKFCHATQIPAGWQPTCVYLGPTASANTNLHCNPHCQVQDFVPARKTLANTRLSESAICWNRRQPLKPLFKTLEKRRLWLHPKKMKKNQDQGSVTYKKVLSDRTKLKWLYFMRPLLHVVFLKIQPVCHRL